MNKKCPVFGIELRNSSLISGLLAFLFLILCTSSFAQNKLHPYAGLHITMDAGGSFLGPSVQAGADYIIKKRLSLSSYLHYFPDGINRKYSDGSFDRGKYRSLTMAALIQRALSENSMKGFFLAGGLALQKMKVDVLSNWGNWHENRTILTLAFRFSYQINLKNNSIAIEINGTGPYKSKEGDPPNVVRTTELLTQLSLGLRLIL